MKIIGIDNPEEKIKELNRKKIIISIFISIVFIILLVMVCIYIGNKPFRDFIDKYVLMKNVVENNVTSIELKESESYSIYAYDKYISVLSQNTLVGYNSSGKQEYELEVEITNPIVDTNNRFLLIAEKEKQRIYLISGNNIVWKKDLEGNISRVSVNKNGYVSVILTGTTHKSVIQVLDASGNTLFKTYLANSIAMDSDISYDNKYLSFAEISTNGTMVQSMIKTISIQKTQEKNASESISDSIIYTVTSPNNSTVLNLKYQDNNKLICMYDNSITSIQEGKEEELINLEQAGQKIVFADMELSNFAFRILEKNVLLSTESSVELVNTTSKKTNIYTVNSVIKEVYAYDDCIALNLGSEVHFIGTNGWLQKKYNSSHEVRKIVMNSNFAGVIYRDRIEIIEL